MIKAPRYPAEILRGSWKDAFDRAKQLLAVDRLDYIQLAGKGQQAVPGIPIDLREQHTVERLARLEDLVEKHFGASNAGSSFEVTHLRVLHLTMDGQTESWLLIIKQRGKA